MDSHGHSLAPTGTAIAPSGAEIDSRYGPALGPDDSESDSRKSPLDLASEAGTAAGFAIECGSDATPVLSAFKAMLLTLNPDARSERNLWQRYDAVALTTVQVLSKNASAAAGICRIHSRAQFVT
jgi:hypothetical protein